MSIVKKVGIDGKEVLFKASAAIPRIYRLKFQRDIYKDLRILEKSIGEGDEEHSNLDLFSLEMFENIAYTMAKHADPAIPDDVEEWLDGFNTFSIYQVLPELIKLWGLNVQTDAEAKKTSANREGDEHAAVSAWCVQLGLSMADTELLSIGLVNDMYTEQVNDGYRYCELGTQEDMDRF